MILGNGLKGHALSTPSSDQGEWGGRDIMTDGLGAQGEKNSKTRMRPTSKRHARPTGRRLKTYL